MQIRYLSQAHQTKALNSIVELFQGEQKQENCYDIFDGESVCSNMLTLDSGAILENLQIIQAKNGVEVSTKLEALDFSIEMETGTGKTYVYIKSILELSKRYGWNKFVIITPPIAIKEGILNSLVLSIEIDKKSRRAVSALELIIKNKEGFIKKSLKIKADDSLKDKTKNPIYSGFIVDEISFKEMFIQFENGLKLELNDINGKVKRQIQERQITEAIKLHMIKFEALKKKNIKVLSLFFIDKVANFLADEDGWMQRYFSEEFDRLKVDFESFRDIEAKDIYAFYFAKRKAGYVDELKNNESDRKLQKETYNLIMKEKEKLLSFDEKTSFIFSHSALKEGWDNPNVFFITTLNDTKSQMKKRQILGRGMRLAVDQNGERTYDKNINRLTVVANESFEEFATNLQLEYDLVGVKNAAKPNNKGDEKNVALKISWMNENKEFLALWETIKTKTVFNLSLDSEQYKEKVIKGLAKIEVREQKIIRQFGGLQSNLEGFVEEEKSYKLDFEQSFPDIVSIIEKEIGVSRSTIVDILKQSDLKPFIVNSDTYIKKALEVFDDEKHKVLLDSEGIVYQKSGEFYQFSNVFADEVNGYDLEDCHKGLYGAEQYDSEIEQKFINCADMNFKFFTKLPKKFKIKTPLGTYNPDFAVVKLDESEGSFIVETKGSEKNRDLRSREDWQIEYAKKHFELLGVKYRKVKDCNSL